MQTVWNRVAQTRASCPSAAHSVKTSVARQTATAAGKRPTKFLTSSTLLYSGIFAVAATTDALVKEKRRKQWDKAIAEMKEGAGTTDLRMQEHSRDHMVDHVDLDSLLDLADAEHEDSQAQTHSPLMWPENTGRRYDRSTFAPQSVYASPEWRAGHISRPLSLKKVQLTELAMDKMTLRILLLLDRKSIQDIALNAFSGTFREILLRPRSDLDNMLQFIDANIRATKSIPAQAESTDFAPYRGLFSRYSKQVTQESLYNAARLEENIIAMFQMHRQGIKSSTQVLLEMLHNVTRSPALPSLECFNTMLEGLSDPIFHKVNMRMVISAMRMCHVRMNETSLISILNFNRRTNDYKDFCYYLELMQGQHGGLWQARPDVNISKISQGRLLRANILGKEKIIQRMNPSPEVFQAVIEGVLHFEGFEAALETYRDMAKSGWGLSMKGLTCLLHDRVDHGDWEGGLSVWDQIKALRKRSLSNQYAERIQAGTYATMMRLCLVCDKREQYETIYREALSAQNTPGRLLQHMRRLADAATLRQASPRTRAQRSIKPRNRSMAQWSSVLGQDAVATIKSTSDDIATSVQADSASAVEPSMVATATDLDDPGIPVYDSPAGVPLSYSMQHDHDGLETLQSEQESSDAALPQQSVLGQKGAGKMDKARAATSASPMTGLQRVVANKNLLRREQLLGLGGPSLDLEIYEFTERPMSMAAIGKEEAYI
ncbi:hypothetical protein CAC42_6220 [Sphaceloma murrayae]|uniref:Uncharacterized protein n=1 Tax=Sphaceloma murrayae TaxID=2082308 RepID=A0A2K1QU39_9PEZI|nr:hypothetical protein CAC42_6220 [Sphaceloma murrayae]